MFLYKFQELSDLVRLGVSPEGLQVELVRYPRMDVDVVTATNAAQFETEIFHELAEVGKAHVCTVTFEDASK